MITARSAGSALVSMLWRGVVAGWRWVRARPWASVISTAAALAAFWWRYAPELTVKPNEWTTLGVALPPVSATNTGHSTLTKFLARCEMIGTTPRIKDSHLDISYQETMEPTSIAPGKHVAISCQKLTNVPFEPGAYAVIRSVYDTYWSLGYTWEQEDCYRLNSTWTGGYQLWKAGCPAPEDR